MGRTWFAQAVAGIALSLGPNQLAETQSVRVNVFMQNPVRTPSPTIEALPYSPRGSALTTKALRVRSCIPRPASADTPALACVLGHAAKADPQGDFIFEPMRTPQTAADPFAEASAYFHAARALQYFVTLAGNRPLPPVEVVVGAQLPRGTSAPGGARVVSTPRSFFLSRNDNDGALLRKQLGLTRSLVWLGYGARQNLAYDGDSVIHEICHAVFESGANPDWQVDKHAADRDGAATAEALADYFTAVITEDALMGEYVASATARDLRGQHELAFRSGDPHEDGLRLSRALWSARAELSKEQARAFDQAVFGLARERAVTSSLESFALALQKHLPQKDPKLIASVAEALERRRLFEPLPPIVEVTPRGSEINPATLFLLPGTRDVRAQAMVPGTVQFRLAIPEGTKNLRGSFTVQPVARSPWAETDNASPKPDLVVLVSWDQPIRWQHGKPIPPVETELTEGLIDVAVPPGARLAFVAIANRHDHGVGMRRPVFSFVD